MAERKTEEDLTVLLTVFKRRTLRLQLEAIERQTIRPKRVVVFQNGNYRKLPIRLLRSRGVDYVLNSWNTKFFGRFAYLLSAETEYVAVLDDDVVPGVRCLENYLNQSRSLGAIIGGNGRIARTNSAVDDLNQPNDIGTRAAATLVDFVGHLWMFHKRNLFDMFSYEPVAYHTGEDMHLCFAAKLRSGVPSYVAAQPTPEDTADTSMNRFANDAVANYRHTPKTERERVETYFRDMGLNFVTLAEQSAQRGNVKNASG